VFLGLRDRAASLGDEPRDDRLPRFGVEHRLGPERELRARADGAAHARREGRLHRGRATSSSARTDTTRGQRPCPSVGRRRASAATAATSRATACSTSSRGIRTPRRALSTSCASTSCPTNRP
jgi:hypothetical protein